MTKFLLTLLAFVCLTVAALASPIPAMDSVAIAAALVALAVTAPVRANERLQAGTYEVVANREMACGGGLYSDNGEISIGTGSDAKAAGFSAGLNKPENHTVQQQRDNGAGSADIWLTLKAIANGAAGNCERIFRQIELFNVKPDTHPCSGPAYFGKIAVRHELSVCRVNRHDELVKLDRGYM